MLVIVSVALAACGPKRQSVTAPAAPATVAESAPAPAPPPPPRVPPAQPSTVAALTADEIFARKTLDELNAERPLADVLFELDEWTIRGAAAAVLEANAEWLRHWPSTRVTVEGHADSRGTNEYNLALGERRAQAVRTHLGTLGITSERVRVLSLGKEAPVCWVDTDDCWQQNRRGHFIITAK
jgi:peptidoglycan-associated lipoprotein